MHYGFDSIERWFIGQVPDDSASSTPEAPPILSVTTTPGEARARWWRYTWTVEPYAPPVQDPAPVAYGFDADGWYVGEVPIGSVNSTRQAPDIVSVTTTPGEPRSRWVGAWSVQAFPAPALRITKRSFWNRFPSDNEVAMRAVMLTGAPALLAAGLQRLQARVEASPYVDLTLAETVVGIGWLQSAQVPETVSIDGTSLPLRLTAGQAAAILSTQIADSERYRE